MRKLGVGHRSQGVPSGGPRPQGLPRSQVGVHVPKWIQLSCCGLIVMSVHVAATRSTTVSWSIGISTNSKSLVPANVVVACHRPDVVSGHILQFRILNVPLKIDGTVVLTETV